MATSSANPTYGNVSHTVEGPSAAQWAAVQQEIRVLYLIEKRPLKEVKQILEDRHNFRATERMFKSRLSAWKFTKNSSDKEYQICAVLHKIRREKGKAHTAFIINGNQRTLKDLWKYIKGRKMSIEEFYTHSVESVGQAQLHDENQVRAITPEPDEDGHDSDPDSDHGNGVLAKLTPTSSDASSNWRHEHRRYGRHHRTSTSSTASLARNMNIASLEHRSVPIPSALTSATFDHSHLQRITATPESYGTPPTSAGYPGPSISQQSSPRRSFSRADIESLAHSTLYSNPLLQTYGTENLDAWAIMSQGASDTSSLSDFDVICTKCHKPTSEHFSSLCNLDSPQSYPDSPLAQQQVLSPRDIFNSTPDLPSPAEHFSIPVSTKQHDHSWKWVSHCFSACIFYSRSRYADSSNHNLVEHTPSALTAPDDFGFARYDLNCANREFRAMILNYDPNILIAVNQAVMVLGMHNWGNITAHIMGSAADVARDVLGEEHPIYLLARFVTLMSSAKTIYTQNEITSTTLENVWQAFVHGWSPTSTSLHGPITAAQRPPYTIPAEGEAGRRAIPALYCYAALLATEAYRSSSPVKESKLAQAEVLLRHCHTLACQTFHQSHLQAVAALLKLQLVLERQGRISEAIETIEQAVRDGRTTLGKWHPRQLESLRTMGALLVKRWAAEDQAQKANGKVKEEEKKNGVNGEAADVDARSRRRREEEEQKVEAILWEVLEGRVRMLGKKHESSLASREDLIEWLSEKGRWTAEGLDKQRLDDIWEWTDLGREDYSGYAGVGGAVGAGMGRRFEEYVQAGY